MPNRITSCIHIRGVNDSLNSITPSQSRDSSFDQTSCSSCSPSKCDPQDSSTYENNIYQNLDTDNLLYEIPPPPSFFSSKRFSDPLQQCSIYQNVSLSDISEGKGIDFIIICSLILPFGISVMLT
ncbi:uncharacterized protein TNCV_3699501 [Trichonephila clavipes]|uniref:Uncharacterized protein n=1 Tax=Trichonephila clavipes TaxID=2585209 RepID=A0A8X6SAN3_TRICX|nr:uncharacterized protein TNCV_3699501 [Trichonephila clavipes]